MLEKFKYINHINESIEFGKNGLYVNYNDLRNYDWNVTSANNKISSFKKGVVTKTIPVIIYCRNESEGLAIKNRIFEVFEKDVLANKHGRIIIGDYCLKCFITGSKKTKYLQNKGYLELSLTVQTDYPSWIKETTVIFNTTSGSTSDYLDYEYDFEYDYASELNNIYINNVGFVDTDFRMVIYGFISNPKIYIDGHEYNVDVTISTGEYLTIDSVQKTIVLTRYNGEQVNCFNQRNRDSFIFQKIKPGTSIVTCEGALKADITLIEERSEPKWI